MFYDFFPYRDVFSTADDIGVSRSSNREEEEKTDEDQFHQQLIIPYLTAKTVTVGLDSLTKTLQRLDDNQLKQARPCLERHDLFKRNRIGEEVWGLYCGLAQNQQNQAYLACRQRSASAPS